MQNLHVASLCHFPQDLYYMKLIRMELNTFLTVLNVT